MSIVKSMTGFGRCTKSNELIEIAIEIKSVNSRFLDLKWRLPHSIRAQEYLLEKTVRQHASRGRVEISATIQELVKSPDVSFAVDRASNMLQAMSDFAHSRGDSYSVDYNSLLRINTLWDGEEAKEAENSFEFAQKCLVEALNDWNNAREIEANALIEDLKTRFNKMSQWLKSIEETAPSIKEQRFQNVRERLQEVLQSMESQLDDSRFMQEMVIISDKLDVSEECIRLHAHLNRLDSLLAQGGEVGRKLDFTLQECFREINTCGNKIQDADLSILVVDFKNELEKCREQVQNLE